MGANVWDNLSTPFPPEEVEWRVGRDGLLLPYVTARGIQKRLDEVVTPAGWQTNYQKWGDKGVLCNMGIWNSLGEKEIDEVGEFLTPGQWVWKANAADESNIESTKGGISNAFRRVAVDFGIGRYLYWLPKFIGYVTNKQIIKIPELPDWALPGGAGGPWETFAEINELVEDMKKDGRLTSGQVETLRARFLGQPDAFLEGLQSYKEKK